jgi:hypothetical protein
MLLRKFTKSARREGGERGEKIAVKVWEMWAGDRAQWWSICLACLRPWIPSPALGEKEKPKVWEI